MASAKKPRQLLEFALIFAAIYLLSQFALKTFFPERFGGEPALPVLSIHAVDATVKGGHHPLLTLKNGTTKDLTLANRCPMPPVDVYFAATGEPDMTKEPLKTEETALPCAPLTIVPTGGSMQIDLAPWKYSLFGAFGNYAVRLPLTEKSADQPDVVAKFSIHEAGVFTQIFRTFITKPFLNFLIFIASLLPDHSLGIAIIILTIVVKLILFFPTQHALQGQKEMQKLQPKLDELKKRYGDDPKKMQEETMKLWKEHKVNPFQSCLPMLVQFPVLIGLFYVIRDGSVLALSQHLIYGFYSHLSWTFGTQFLWLDLLKPDIYVMPAALVILQFLQMKLTFTLNDRKKAKEKVVDVGDKKKEPMSPQKMQQNIMLYGLPIMIGVFAFQFPAAVSLYWGVSTLFGIGQQLVVNRKTT
ncbi:hypothetical protein A3D88_03115 [Candidatus Peribacteria bacterium RIFCSPHIGHO2_02_FULL_52_16]|nr:MAG: hypothetical protein A3D88_03115 [Candidatus Peribacteria bacterium RIFCSPHIGHO2_02_FULL_52_16]